MKKARVPSTICTSLALIAAPVFAEPFPEGCFARDYDTAHLAAHPAQVVSQMALHLWRENDETLFRIRVRMADQGHARHDGTAGLTMREEGLCQESGPCYVYCDGGGFRLTSTSPGAIEITTEWMRVVQDAPCEGEALVSDLAEVSGQPTTYRLLASPAATCAE